MLKYIYNIYNKNNIENMLNYNIIYKYNKILNFNSNQIKIGSYAKVEYFNKFIVKTFSDSDNYFNEKEIYTTKLPQYCGCFYYNKNQFVYEYNNKIININPQYEDDKIIISDLEIINNIIQISSKQINKIIIIKSDINILAEIDSNKIIIGFCINKNKTINIYINSFKIMRLLHFNDTNNSLYYENLGIDLKESYTNRYPSYKQRIFMSIDIIRQVKELLDICIYHNDIKNNNIVLKSNNLNYYINLIDYGISITINDLLKFEYLTTPYSLSPEYYIINILLQNNKSNLNIYKIIKNLKNIFPDIYKKFENNTNISTKDMKELLDNSLHWAIGAIIINILSWKDVQYPVWVKYYNPYNYKVGVDISYFNHIHIYSSQDIAFNYTREMLCELFQNDFLYEDIFYFSNSDITSLINTINKFSDYKSIMNIIDDRFKEELLDLILIIYNLFEFLPENKMSLSDMYNKLKNYPGYQKYLNSKPKFI